MVAAAAGRHQEQAGAPPNDTDSHNHQPTLSRKERQRLAKAAEREERKVLEEERREQQKLAQEEAHRRKLERQKLQARQQQQAKEREQYERTLAEKARQEAWETFLHNVHTGTKLSMDDWLDRCEHNPLVHLDALATELDLSLTEVKHAIDKAVQDHRVVGVFYDESLFVVFNQTKLDDLVTLIQQKGEMNAIEIAQWMSDQTPVQEKEEEPSGVKDT